VNELIRQLHAMEPGDPYRTRLRNRVVQDCLPLADKLARRFTGLGELPADLAQVASLGLLKAVDGFDPEYGTDFGGYATPTIIGELKRHFRDKGWGVHVPRRLQELRLDVNRARDELTHLLGRSPTTTDVATHLKIAEETVIEAMAASAAYRPSSLYLPLGDEQESTSTIADMLGEEDQELDLVDLRVSLRPLLAQLPEREQRILSMRFFGNLTQADIAAQLGISQMHVSRLLSRTLRKLRQAMLAPEVS
jgi:RNA polymerase sigma-B factor